MKKLVVVLVVMVLLFALTTPVFAFGVPGAHGELVDRTEFGRAVAATVQTDLCFFVDHVSGWKPGLK